ncbi:interleukin-17 receptor E isoform X4 [Vidua chalybeata]|uniref:interleukin-17 receptor E isoform X4 n=1 Tax=Vidua chalybeata TaxID=81927 RepID=UPI0023A800E0|nr:interleukin-17 receptor E isoform X4 [Vidua chalybeata]
MQGGDPRGLGPWRVPGVRAPSSACCSMEIKHRPLSHACLRRRKRRLARGGPAGPHVPVEECGGAGPGRGGERRRSAMGRPVLLAAAAVLLLLPPSRTGAAVTRLRVSANFECRATADRTLSRPRCRRPTRPVPPLEPPALSLSPARLCLPAQPCQPCLRVRLALPTSGTGGVGEAGHPRGRGHTASSPTHVSTPRRFLAELGGVRGLQLTFLELDSNRAGWLQVWQRRRVLGSSTVSLRPAVERGTPRPGVPPLTPCSPQWQVQFDCFPAESGRQVLVSLRTIPDRGLALSCSHMVTAEPPGPVFTHAWVPEVRAIEVWVPAGPALMVRLCHQLALECEELPRPFHQQVLVPGGHHISLPYEFLVPCLCIEASYSHHDSPRSKHCPFRDRPDAYGPELWSSVRFHDYSTSSKDQMAMVLSASCPLHPQATLCWREAADEAAPCHDIPNSTASEDEQVYILDKVDVHPELCFRFSYKNSSHVECPHQPETAWNVSVSVRGFQLHLHLTSRIPAAFSAALCQRQGGQCEPEAPLYTVTQAEGSAPGELALLLPVQVLGSCVLVWRSDVHFARKQLLCPDVSHRHFGLLGLVLALGLVVTVLLLNCRGAWRPNDGVPGRRPVLLLYSPDSEEHLGLVCALAQRLRTGLGCDVRLDLWEAGGLGQAGALPWLYAQRGRVGRQRGTVLLLWSRGSARLFHQWQVGIADGTPGDAHDIFGAAMACLHGELGAAGRGGGWVLAYFSRLCSPRDVPRPLRPLPTYRLPRQLPGLLGALRGSPPAPRHCRWGRAGGLLHRLLEVGAREGSPPPRPPGAASGT